MLEPCVTVCVEPPVPCLVNTGAAVADEELDETELEEVLTEELTTTLLDDTELEETPVKQFDARTSHKVAPAPRVPCTAA